MLASPTKVAIDEAQELIALETELLDAWRLDDWLKLYTDDLIYLVPTPGMPRLIAGEQPVPDQRRSLPDGEQGQAAEEANRAFRISALDHRAYDYELARGRAGPDEGTHVNGAFHVSRIEDGIMDIFLGRVGYCLVKQGEAVLIRSKRCDLAMDELVPQGRLTIIL